LAFGSPSEQEIWAAATFIWFCEHKIAAAISLLNFGDRISVVTTGERNHGVTYILRVGDCVRKVSV
jgi:hypothetical protein